MNNSFLYHKRTFIDQIWIIHVISTQRVRWRTRLSCSSEAPLWRVSILRILVSTGSSSYSFDRVSHINIVPHKTLIHKYSRTLPLQRGPVLREGLTKNPLLWNYDIFLKGREMIYFAFTFFISPDWWFPLCGSIIFLTPPYWRKMCEANSCKMCSIL